MTSGRRPGPFLDRLHAHAAAFGHFWVSRLGMGPNEWVGVKISGCAAHDGAHHPWLVYWLVYERKSTIFRDFWIGKVRMRAGDCVGVKISASGAHGGAHCRLDTLSHYTWTHAAPRPSRHLDI